FSVPARKSFHLKFSRSPNAYFVCQVADLKPDLSPTCETPTEAKSQGFSFVINLLTQKLHEIHVVFLVDAVSAHIFAETEKTAEIIKQIRSFPAPFQRHCDVIGSV